MTLVYSCSLDGLIASIILLICMSLWIKASAKLLNVNVFCVCVCVCDKSDNIMFNG